MIELLILIFKILEIILPKVLKPYISNKANELENKLIKSRIENYEDFLKSRPKSNDDNTDGSGEGKDI